MNLTNNHLRITVLSLLILSFSLRACVRDRDILLSAEEEVFFTEVILRREQGRNLANYGLQITDEESFKSVYKAIIKYYDRTDELFATLLKKHPSLHKVECNNNYNDIELTDVELVKLLQMHVYATLELYQHGVLTDINKRYKKNLLVMIPALLAQNEDLTFLLNLQRFDF